ncbi:MAG: NAD-dependent epimerase/dehydratase family protein [Phycisphaerales bacterium]|nr:MAG: NAD-dependent epimerase/dehydratase family protein [Phycisphaerales bacterium]
MKALVTGGGGYLGSRIARMLYARGDDVVILGRRQYPEHAKAGIPAIQADLRDAAAIVKACEGVDAVFHVGAFVGIWGRRRIFWDINVNGTKNVLAGCRAHGVRKLVYTSSASVVFDEKALCGVNESQPYATRYLAAYPETKATAERMILAANEPTLATVALRPHLIWGPGDPHLIPRVIERARHRRLVQVGDGENLVDVTYVDNAAEAHLQAADALTATAPCAGRAYFLSQGEPVPLWPWLTEILAAAGVPKVTEIVSYRRAYRVGALLEVVNRFVPMLREPRMTRFLAVQLAKSHFFDISAARRDLGYQPRISTAEGVRRLRAWLCASCGRNSSSGSGAG